MLTRNNKSIVKTQQRFKSKRNCIQFLTSGTSKDLVSKKEEIKCNDITKQYKKRLSLSMLQKKT